MEGNTNPHYTYVVKNASIVKIIPRTSYEISYRYLLLYNYS